ncbi:hypothetical protein ACFONG_09030 [Uliginosibacterium paludis]|uniref:Uncharacterized protein n=1 Tax=Uliginosibacterium paludis TaxID=1615952 RepID=A0ABV2CK26_9RHOO
MDPLVLQLLARIKIRIRQEKGLAVNTQRFFAEPQYAMQILDAAEECEDFELVSSALELRDKLGMIQVAGHTSALKPAARAPAMAAPERSAAPERYKFGARS